MRVREREREREMGERGEGEGEGRDEGEGVHSTTAPHLTHHLHRHQDAQYFLPIMYHLFVCLLFVWFNKKCSCFGWMFKSTQRYAPHFHAHTITNLNFKITKGLKSNKVN